MSMSQSSDFANLDSDEVFVTGMVFGVLAAVAVFLRFLTKITNPTGLFGWDDWWILIACLLFWLEDGLQIAGKPFRVSRLDDSNLILWVATRTARTEDLS